MNITINLGFSISTSDEVSSPLIAPVTNIMFMALGCQSTSRSPAVILDMRVVYCSLQNPRVMFSNMGNTF